MQELVVLVDDENRALGTAPKAEVHGAVTPLHRAFSFFGFDGRGRFLIQQRSSVKKTWPLVWTNTCCGHPLPDEKTEDAVARRLKFELGIEADSILEILPDYRYQATHLGVMENEICPVFVGRIGTEFELNSDEVEAVDWIDFQDFVARLKDPEDSTYDHFSVWCREEAVLLSESEMFIDFMKFYAND